jgi:hypothetical protein
VALASLPGKSPGGSPQYVSRNFHGGVRLADRALAKLVPEGDSGKLTSGAAIVKILLARCLNHCKATGNQRRLFLVGLRHSIGTGHRPFRAQKQFRGF